MSDLGDAAKDTATTALARRCVETRRVMLGAWRDESIGRAYALDLMGIPPDRLGTQHIAFADTVRAASIESLAAATLFVADEDMSTLLDVAAPTMPDQPLQESDMLAPHGWLWFADPLPDRTGGPQVPFKAIQWTLLDPEHPLMEANRGEGRPMSGSDERPYAVLIQTYSDTLEYTRVRRAWIGDTSEVLTLAPGAPGIIPSASVIWNVGSPIGTAFGRSADDLATDSRLPIGENDPDFYQRALAAFWTLSRQPITTTTETAAARPDRKRSARAGVTNVDEPVRVLRLRGHATAGRDHASGTGRTVSVRFAVRGHWRNQYLPSSQSHRQQWIAAYLKGPETGALVGGERVFLAEGRDVDVPANPAPGDAT